MKTFNNRGLIHNDIEQPEGTEHNIGIENGKNFKIIDIDDGLTRWQSPLLKEKKHLFEYNEENIISLEELLNLDFLTDLGGIVKYLNGIGEQFLIYGDIYNNTYFYDRFCKLLKVREDAQANNIISWFNKKKEDVQVEINEYIINLDKYNLSKAKNSHWVENANNIYNIKVGYKLEDLDGKLKEILNRLYDELLEIYDGIIGILISGFFDEILY